MVSCLILRINTVMDFVIILGNHRSIIYTMQSFQTNLAHRFLRQYCKGCHEAFVRARASRNIDSQKSLSTHPFVSLASKQASIWFQTLFDKRSKLPTPTPGKSRVWNHFYNRSINQSINSPKLSMSVADEAIYIQSSL